MDVPIHIDAIGLELSILYFKVGLSKKWCIGFILANSAELNKLLLSVTFHYIKKEVSMHHFKWFQVKMC